MSSPYRLSDSADRITSENLDRNLPPPRAAIANPLVELLVRDVQRQMPEEIQRRLADAGDSSQLLDWIGIAVLAKSLAHVSDRKRFVDNIAGNPQHLAAAWAKTAAPQFAPAKPTDDQVALDVIGLILQLLLVAGFLAMRWAIVYFLSAGSTLAQPWDGLAAVVYLHLLAHPVALWTKPFWGLVLAAVLCVLELLVAPIWMERLRRLPFEGSNAKPLSRGRADTFYVAWCVQAVMFAIAAGYRLFGN